MTLNVTLPIKRVVVMEDRAQVERAGPLTVAGLTRFEVSGVALVAVDRTLRVEVQGASLVDAKLVRRWVAEPKGGLAQDASDLDRRIHELELQVEAGQQEVQRLETKGTQLELARKDVLRAIAEQAGAGQAAIERWGQELDALEQAVAKRDEAQLVARRALHHTSLRLDEARVARAAAQEPEKRLDCVLQLTIDGNGEAQVKVGYLVPCAVWRPAYRATLAADGSKVLVEAEAVVWQRTGEAWSDVKLSLSTARPTLGTAPPSLMEDRLSTRPKMDVEKRVVDVSVREEVIQSSGERGGSGAEELPGLDDGGEARLLEAKGLASLPSDGQPHRIPLFSFEAPAQLERVCPVELSPLVTLVARLTNTSGQVLLAGPVQLVRASGYVGRTQLKFTAPGEALKIPFGSEDALRVVRKATEKTDETVLTGRKHTVHSVTHFVSNAGASAAQIILEERVPVSEVKEVEIEVLTKDCKPAPSEVSKEGIARIALSLPPNSTQQAVFTWRLSAAAKVAGL